MHIYASPSTSVQQEAFIVPRMCLQKSCKDRRACGLTRSGKPFLTLYCKYYGFQQTSTDGHWYCNIAFDVQSCLLAKPQQRAASPRGAGTAKGKPPGCRKAADVCAQL